MRAVRTKLEPRQDYILAVAPATEYARNTLVKNIYETLTGEKPSDVNTKHAYQGGDANHMSLVNNDVHVLTQKECDSINVLGIEGFTNLKFYHVHRDYIYSLKVGTDGYRGSELYIDQSAHCAALVRMGRIEDAKTIASKSYFQDRDHLFEITSIWKRDDDDDVSM